MNRDIDVIAALGEWEIGINTWRTIQGIKTTVKVGKCLVALKSPHEY